MEKVLYVNFIRLPLK